MFGAENLPKLLEESEKWRKLLEAYPTADFMREFTRLNDNAEKMQREAEHYRPLIADLRVLIGILKDLQEKGKATVNLAKQVHVLNQILLKVSKVAGYSGMFQTLLASLMEFAKRQK